MYAKEVTTLLLGIGREATCDKDDLHLRSTQLRRTGTFQELMNGQRPQKAPKDTQRQRLPCDWWMLMAGSVNLI